jgi:hypothetical protein
MKLVVSEPVVFDSAGRLFVTTNDGHLVEHYWKPNVGWVWADHGTPTPSTQVVGKPVVFDSAGRLFVTTNDGHLVEHYWKPGVGWIWADHGTP